MLLVHRVGPLTPSSEVMSCDAGNGRRGDKISSALRTGAVKGETAVIPFRIFVIPPKQVQRYYRCLLRKQHLSHRATRPAKKLNRVIGLVIRLEFPTHGPPTTPPTQKLGLHHPRRRAHAARRKPTKAVPALFHGLLADARLTRYGAAASATRLPVSFSSGSKTTRTRARRTSATRRKVASE